MQTLVNPTTVKMSMTPEVLRLLAQAGIPPQYRHIALLAVNQLLGSSVDPHIQTALDWFDQLLDTLGPYIEGEQFVPPADGNPYSDVNLYETMYNQLPSMQSVVEGFLFGNE